jgi:hypothetical protein
VRPLLVRLALAAALAGGVWAHPLEAAPARIAETVKLAPATPGAVRFTVFTPEPRLMRVDAEAGVDAVLLEGYEPTGRPGEPAIPVRTMLVAVPPVGEVKLTAVASELAVSDGLTLAPNPGLGEDRQPASIGRRPEAYGAAGSARPAAARLLSVTWMRNQRVARIAIEPVAYEPAARRMTLAKRIDIELAVPSLGALGPPAESPDPFEAVYRSSLINYEQGRAWRRPRTEALLAAARRAGVPLGAMAALATPADTSVYVGRTWVKMAIQRTGFYTVNFSRLRGTTLVSASDSASFDSLRVFTWPGIPVLPENSYCDTCDYREVAMGIVSDEGNDGQFSKNNDKIYFFAQGPDGWASDYDPNAADTAYVNHPYDRFNFYYLTLATVDRPVSGDAYPVAPKRIGLGAGLRSGAPIGGETPQSTVPGRLHVERDLEPWVDASAVGSTLVWEKWFWRSLVVGQAFEDTVDLPDAEISLPARFRMRHWGLSSNLFLRNCTWPGFDHRLDVTYNDVVFPRRQWAGYTSSDRAALTYDTTGVFLRQMDNVVRVSVPQYFVPGCGSFIDRSGLAFCEYYYARRLQPVEDAIDFRTYPLSGRFEYDIGPFVKQPLYVFDITDPLHPVRLTGTPTDSGSTGWMLTLADSQSVPHRYAVVPESVLVSDRAVISAGAVSDAPFTSLENLRSATQGADYLVLYFDGFAAAADSLDAWRTQRLPLVPGPPPYLTKKVPISAIYDQFSGGRLDPGAVRNFLRAASGWSKRPLYVTFLGDASFDFKDITGRAVPGQPGCLLPSFENNFDPHFLIRRQYATDDWMVNVDDPIEVLPDYLSGRIPAGDATSALNVVTRKILAYERSAPFGEYRNAALLMADDNQQGEECNDPIGWGHVTQTDQLNLVSTPTETDREFVYLHTYPNGPGFTKPDARVALFRDLNDGASLFNFVGHGSPFKMSDEGVFLDSDAGTLTNGLRLPLMVAASCDIGKFNDPTVQSLGERMMMSTTGGAIGVISSTEQALSGLNSFLNLLIYDALFTRDTLTIAGITFPSTGQYHMPASAALLAAKSVPQAQGTNSQKYQLMGDPATLLNLPRQWAEVRITDEAGAPLTQVARGQRVRFDGRVLDRPGGTLVPLDGVASVLIEDSAPTNLTPDDCPVGSVPYRFSAGPLYRGDVTLAGGLFQGAFVASMDASAGALARVRVYVQGRAAAVGYTDGVGDTPFEVTPGTPPAGDVEGPRISLSFVGGSTNVRGDATLQINLFDDSGIMTTAHAPQNSIVVTVDGNTTTRTDVTRSFRYAADSHQSGTASFQLPGLSAGPHTVMVSAADNLATGLDAALHRASATLEFRVVDTPPLSVNRTYLFPSPVRSGGPGSGGVFVVDAPGDSINTMVRVYTVAGKLVRSLSRMGGSGQVQLTWDGLDAEGDPLAQGTYLYKVYVSGREADGRSSASQRATAEGRFIVLNP